MRHLLRLENPIRDYAWGSRSWIAELTGRGSPAAGPEAELWMGAHPQAPSQVCAEGRRVALGEWIARDPAGVLGARVAERFGARLPFLLKLLAAERPLSIQAHPDARQARQGFERENARGIAPDAPERHYRDPFPKPELICALAPFEALRGFRPPAEIGARLDALATPALAQERALLESVDEGEALRAWLAALLRMEPERAQRVVGELAEAAGARAGDDPACAWLVRLAALHPGDPGALAPLFLNWLRLEPGQAMFLPAGELHAYLCGFGIEVMASSDNVLRGGLTAKHVDVAELLEVLRFRSDPVQVLVPERLSDREAVYATPAAEFRLSRIAVGEPLAIDERVGVEILLCTEGEVRVRAEREPQTLALPQGASCLLAASAGTYRLEGAGSLWRAAVPA